MKKCINYNSEKELYSIISNYINSEHLEILKFIVYSNEIEIYYKKNKIKKSHTVKNNFEQPEKITKIYRAIKALKYHNVIASRKNIAKYLSISIEHLSSVMAFYKLKGYKINTDNKRLEHKDHPIYHKMYTVWRGMVQRCCNPNHQMYHRYGGREILISDEWRYSPDQFFIDMHETYIKNSTLDRIDNDKGYCKENCRWADHSTQHRNTSRSLKIIYKNEKIHFYELLEKLQLTKYMNILRPHMKKCNDWNVYISNFGIRFKNEEFCCPQHLIDSINVSSDNIILLMRRYRRQNKKLPNANLANINFYITNCYNFSDNLIRISQNKKVLKKDLIQTNM